MFSFIVVLLFFMSESENAAHSRFLICYVLPVVISRQENSSLVAEVQKLQEVMIKQFREIFNLLS